MTLTVQWTSDRTGSGKLRERARKAGQWFARAAVAVAKPHRGALRNLAHMPLSLAGTAGLDFASFHVSHGVGWLVTGISLIIVEFVAADE